MPVCIQEHGYCTDCYTLSLPRQWFHHVWVFQILALNRHAKILHVILDIDTRLANIKIQGLPKNVSIMSDLIIKELKDIDKGIFEEKAEILLAKAVQWKYTNREEKLKNFAPSINKVGDTMTITIFERKHSSCKKCR